MSNSSYKYKENTILGKAERMADGGNKNKIYFVIDNKFNWNRMVSWMDALKFIWVIDAKVYNPKYSCILIDRLKHYVLVLPEFRVDWGSKVYQITSSWSSEKFTQLLGFIEDISQEEIIVI